MMRPTDRMRFVLATLVLLLGLALVAPAIMVALMAMRHFYTAGFDPATLRQLEFATGAGILLIAIGALILGSTIIRRKRA